MKTALIQTIIRGGKGQTIDDFGLLDIYKMKPFTSRTKIKVVLNDGSYINSAGVKEVSNILSIKGYGLASDQLMIASMLRADDLVFYRNGASQKFALMSPHIIWGHIEAHSEKLNNGMPDSLGLSVEKGGEVIAYNFSNAEYPTLHIGELIKSNKGSDSVVKMLMVLSATYLKQRRAEQYDLNFIDGLSAWIKKLSN